MSKRHLRSSGYLVPRFLCVPAALAALLSAGTAEAAGVLGRVGVKRTPTLLESLAGELKSVAAGAGVMLGAPVSAEDCTFGTVTVGAADDAATVSAGAGAGLVVELQPGFANIRMRAKT